MQKPALSIDFPHSPALNQALSFSEDCRIALATEEGIHIVSLQCVTDETNLSHTRQFIPANTNQSEFDIGISRRTLQGSLTEDELPTYLYDRTLNPLITSTWMMSYGNYLSVMWSPVSCDGRCILATLTYDHRLVLHRLSDHKLSWQKVADVTEDYYKCKRDENFLSLDKVQHLGVDMKNEKLCQLTKRSYGLAAVAMEWSPVYRTHKPLVSPTKKVKLDDPNEESFAYLSTLMKNGDILMWKISFPCITSSDCKVVACFNTGTVLPTAICWCPSSSKDSAIVAIGNQSGLVFAYKISNLSHGEISFENKVELWDEQDKLEVNNFCWCEKENMLFVGKERFIIMFELGTLKSLCVIQKSTVKTNNWLPISGISNRGIDVLVCSTDGLLQKIVITAKKEVSCSQIAALSSGKENRELAGVDTSANKTLWAYLSSLRNYTYDKSNKRIQIVDYSLVTDISSVYNQNFTLLGDKKVSCTLHIFVNCSLKEAAQQFTTKDSDTIKSDCLLATHHLISRSTLGFEIPVDQSETMSYDQLARFYKKCFLANAEDFKREALKKDILDLEEEILCKHFMRKLRDVPSERYQSNQVELKPLYNWLKDKDGLIFCELKRLIITAKENLSGEEKCEICQEPVPVESMFQGSCKNGHTFVRCCQSLNLCRGRYIKTCVICQSCSIMDNSGSSWFKDICSSVCTFCGHVMT